MLYLDMDGVLMDFDNHIAKWGCNWKGEVYHHKPESEWKIGRASCRERVCLYV